MTATVRTRCGACGEWNSFEADARIDAIVCGSCARPIGLSCASERLTGGGPPDRCLRCGASDFWTHKDFPKALGLSIIAAAAVLSFALAHRSPLYSALVLAAAVVFDAALYPFLPWTTVCYRCKTEYRGTARDPAHGGFDLAHAEDVEAEEAERAARPGGSPAAEKTP